MGICYTQRRSAARVRTVAADVASQVVEMGAGDVAVRDIWEEVEMSEQDIAHEQYMQDLQDKYDGMDDLSDIPDYGYEKWLEREALLEEAAFQRDQSEFAWPHSYEMA